MRSRKQRFQYKRKAREMPKMTIVQQASKTSALGSRGWRVLNTDISKRN